MRTASWNTKRSSWVPTPCPGASRSTARRASRRMGRGYRGSFLREGAGRPSISTWPGATVAKPRMCRSSTATYVTPTWCLNWFWPANLWKKRSRSESPDWNCERSSLSRSALISITHQIGERSRGLAGLDLLEDRLARLARHHQSGMDDHVGRQLLQRLEVVPQRLLHEIALLQAGGADIALQQL